MQKPNPAASVTAAILALSGFVGVFWALGKLFEYSLWCVAGKDIPFVLDVVAGVVSGPINIWVAVACGVATACGYPAPFIH